MCVREGESEHFLRIEIFFFLSASSGCVFQIDSGDWRRMSASYSFWQEAKCHHYSFLLFCVVHVAMTDVSGTKIGRQTLKYFLNCKYLGIFDLERTATGVNVGTVKSFLGCSSCFHTPKCAIIFKLRNINVFLSLF